MKYYALKTSNLILRIVAAKNIINSTDEVIIIYDRDASNIGRKYIPYWEHLDVYREFADIDILEFL